MIARIAIILLMLILPCATAAAQVGPPDGASQPAGKAPASSMPAPLAPPVLGEGDTTDPLNPAAILAGAASALPGLNPPSGETSTEKGKGLSTALNVMMVLTVITLVPSIVLMTTCFLRIVVVLSLLKQALGTQQMPPSQVMVGLSLILTLLVMSPTLDRINIEAIKPYQKGEVTNYDDLWQRARQPIRDFMFAQIENTGNYSSLYMVLNYRGIDTSDPSKLTREKVDMISLVPAFVLSELKVAFLMGFRIFLPFLVIDLVVSAILIAMNMMMLPPVLISLPFKLLLFVIVDGWTLIVGTLLASFARVPGPPPTNDAVSMLDSALQPLLPHTSVVHDLALAGQQWGAWLAQITT